jgi:hypothetical protein
MKHRFRAHELVVYEKHKHGRRPGPRARDLRPAPRGDDYEYVVDKYWIVQEICPDARLVLRTPGGKLHQVAPDDPNLRVIRWRERLWLAWRDRTRLESLRHASV